MRSVLRLLGLLTVLSACGSRAERRATARPGARSSEPASLVRLDRACAPGGETVLVTQPPPASNATTERLTVHASGLVEIAILSARDDGSICPVAEAGTDDEACLAPEVARELVAGHGEPGSALDDRVRRAKDDALRFRLDAACAAGSPCGVALERVDLEHPHHSTSFHFRAELWSDGRFRCERPEPGTGVHAGGCAFRGASMGRVAPEAARTAIHALLGGDSMEAVREASDQAALHAQRDFDRMLLRLPDAVPIGGPVVADAFALWGRIAADLDARCVPPG